MTEFQLKYGCNPNQKPARLFMEDGSALPIEVLNGRPGFINFLDAFNGWQLVTELKRATGLPAAAQGWPCRHGWDMMRVTRRGPGVPDEWFLCDVRPHFFVIRLM